MTCSISKRRNGTNNRAELTTKRTLETFSVGDFESKPMATEMLGRNYRMVGFSHDFFVPPALQAQARIHQKYTRAVLTEIPDTTFGGLPTVLELQAVRYLFQKSAQSVGWADQLGQLSAILRNQLFNLTFAPVLMNVVCVWTPMHHISEGVGAPPSAQ